jgi:hypothetical protein
VGASGLMHGGQRWRTRMLPKLTRDHEVNANDVRGLLGTGVSCEQIEDAPAVCVTFNTIESTTLSRSFGWDTRSTHRHRGESPRPR